MKKILFLLSGLLVSLSAAAGPDDFRNNDENCSTERSDYDYDKLYRCGFDLNNCVADYKSRFFAVLVREYGLSRADLRFYTRQGHSPSDLLFGLELARRTDYALRYIMDLYYRSENRDWINISSRLGSGPSTPAFGLILDVFRSRCRYWADYYARRHPRRTHPPLYNHPWSYFRPRVPHPNNPLQIGPFNPGPVRRPKPGHGRKIENPYYRRGPVAVPDRPAGGISRPGRPPFPDKSGRPGKPSRPGRDESTKPAAGRPAGHGDYRRGENHGGKRSESVGKGRRQPGSSKEAGSSYRRR